MGFPWSTGPAFDLRLKTEYRGARGQEGPAVPLPLPAEKWFIQQSWLSGAAGRRWQRAHRAPGSFLESASLLCWSLITGTGWRAKAGLPGCSAHLGCAHRLWARGRAGKLRQAMRRMVRAEQPSPSLLGPACLCEAAPFGLVPTRVQGCAAPPPQWGSSVEDTQTHQS